MPAQIHYMTGDSFGHPSWAENLAASIRAVGAPVELFEYAGDDHLFTMRRCPTSTPPASYGRELLHSAPSWTKHPGDRSTTKYWYSTGANTAQDLEGRRWTLAQARPTMS